MTSTAGLLVRLVLSLGLVLLLMAAVAAVARRTGLGGAAGGRRGAPIEVVARQPLGRRSSIALVRAGGRGLVLGVTDQHVTVLAETDPDDLLPLVEPEQQPGTAAAPAPWTALLDGMRERTVRRERAPR